MVCTWWLDGYDMDGGVTLGEVRDEGCSGRGKNEREFGCEGRERSLLLRESKEEVRLLGQEGDKRLWGDVRRVICRGWQRMLVFRLQGVCAQDVLLV